MNAEAPPPPKEPYLVFRLLLVGLAISIFLVVYDYLSRPPLSPLVRWNQLLLNDTGEPMLVTQIVKLWPLPIGNVSSISTTGVTSGWIPLGESYLVRWMVSDRDLFVVDDVPLMSLLPANTLDIAARGRGGSLTTRLVFLREGRLRVDWFLCPKLDCVEAYFSKDFRYQGSQEFQGRLEATSRYPAIE